MATALSLCRDILGQVCQAGILVGILRRLFLVCVCVSVSHWDGGGWDCLLSWKLPYVFLIFVLGFHSADLESCYSWLCYMASDEAESHFGGMVWLGGKAGPCSTEGKSSMFEDEQANITGSGNWSGRKGLRGTLKSSLYCFLCIECPRMHDTVVLGSNPAVQFQACYFYVYDVCMSFLYKEGRGSIYSIELVGEWEWACGALRAMTSAL